MNILASSILLAVSSSVLATSGPLYKSKCQLKLNHPLLSTGVYFDESCQTAYVAPPVIGDFEVNHLHKESTTDLFCPDYDISKQAATAKKELLDSYIKRVKEYNQLIKESKLGDYRTEEEIINSKIITIQAHLSDEELKVSTLKIQLNTEYNNYKKCLSDILVEDKETCKALLKKASETQKKLFSYEEKQTSLENELYQEQINLLKVQQKIKLELARDAELKEIQEKTASLIESIEKIRAESLNIFQKYASLIGGSASLSYAVNWQQLVNDYAAKNPNVNLTWLPLPINNATFHVNLRADTVGENQFPVVLATNFPGIKSQTSTINPPAGGAVSTLATALSTREPAEIGFSHTMRGSLDLSVNAMCTLTSKNESDYNKIFDTYVSPKVDYNFQLKVRRKYSAKYNLEALYKRIEKLKSKGGFFSSKAKHEIIEDKNSKEIFDIKFDADDSYFSWTPEEQDKLTKDIKATLLNRVLKQISLFNNLGTNLTLPTAPETGVGKLADLLNNGDCAKPEVKAKAVEAVANENNPPSVSNNDDSTPENNKPAETVKAFNDACKFTFDKNLLGSLVKDKDSVLASVASNFSSGNFLAIPGSILSSFSSSSTKVSFFQNNSHTAEEKVDQVSFVDKTTTVTFRPKAQ